MTFTVSMFTCYSPFILHQKDPVIGADILVLVNQRINTVQKRSSTPTILCGDLNADPLSETYSILHENFVSVYSLVCPCEPPHRANELDVLEFCDAVTDGGAPAEPLFTTWKFRYLSLETLY